MTEAVSILARAVGSLRRRSKPKSQVTFVSASTMTKGGMRSRFFAIISRLDVFGLRPPRPLLIWLNRLYQGYRRHIVWQWQAGLGQLEVIQVRTLRQRRPVLGLREFATLGRGWTVSVEERSHRRFLEYTVEYPGNLQSFPPPFICRLESAFVHVPSGGVIGSGGAVIAESTGFKVERFVAMGRPPEDLAARPGSYTTILYSLHRNYYHWMIDCLPRTYLLSKLQDRGPVGLLIPPGLAAFQHLTLKCCLPENVQPFEVNVDWVRAEQLVLPSFAAEPNNGSLPSECLNYIRGRVFQHLGLADVARTRRRIYVSRARTAWRRILNEPEVIETLAKFGFEAVRPEELSFEEQVKLFHSAEAVVGARGAGLTNMIFSKDLRILELTGTRPFVGVAYFSLARAMAHQYHYVFSTPVGHDFRVDLRALEKAVLEMGLSG